MLKRGTLPLLVRALLVLAVVTPVPQGLRSQETPKTRHQESTALKPQPPQPLTRAEKQAVVDSLCKMLDASYIYPAMAPKMIDFLRQQLRDGAYDSLSEPQAFSYQLRKDLLSVSHDQHFNVVFDPAWVSAQKNAVTKKDSVDLLSRDSVEGAHRNFGFAEVRVLPGNFGYLRLTQFDNPQFAGETVAAAMRFLGHTDALIIDLRNNGGGYSTMVQLLASYLFDGEPVHIIDIYSRETARLGEGSTSGPGGSGAGVGAGSEGREKAGKAGGTENAGSAGGSYRQDWTLPFVPGRLRAGIDVYILTNRQTFSAAESFSYFFKNRKRATLVGETTGGGAHLVDRKILTERFYIFMPVERPVDPITGTDWEGSGVKPDVEVPGKIALIAAQRLALEKALIERPGDLSLAWALDAVKAEEHPVVLEAALLQSYVGIYGDRRIGFEGGRLFFLRGGSGTAGSGGMGSGSSGVSAAGVSGVSASGYAMVPLGEKLFMIPELPYMRIDFVVEGGKVAGMRRMYDDGRSVEERKQVTRPSKTMQMEKN